MLSPGWWVIYLQTAICSSEEALEWLNANKINVYAADLNGAKQYQTIDYTTIGNVMGTEADG